MIAENQRRLDELMNGAEAEAFASMERSARSSTDAEGKTLRSLHERTSSLTQLVDALTEEQRMLEAEKNYWERKLILVDDEHQQSKYEAEPSEEPALKAKLDFEKFEADSKQTLEEMEENERGQREGKDKAQGTELSISKMERKNTIAEKVQVINEYQRRRREAEEKIGTYEVGSSGIRKPTTVALRMI